MTEVGCDRIYILGVDSLLAIVSETIRSKVIYYPTINLYLLLDLQR